MTMVTRNAPTTKGAAAIRAGLSASGIKARVAKQRFAYRVIADDPRAMAALVTLGLRGPTGGDPVCNRAREFFAYDFGAL